MSLGGKIDDGRGSGPYGLTDGPGIADIAPDETVSRVADDVAHILRVGRVGHRIEDGNAYVGPVPKDHANKRRADKAQTPGNNPIRRFHGGSGSPTRRQQLLNAHSGESESTPKAAQKAVLPPGSTSLRTPGDSSDSAAVSKAFKIALSPGRSPQTCDHSLTVCLVRDVPGRARKNGVKRIVIDGTSRRSHRAIAYVDTVEEIGARSGADSPLGRGAYAVVRGWALHEGRHEPVESLRVSVGTETTVEAFLGLPRPDVAERFGRGALNAGFVAVFPLTAPCGPYQLTLEALAGDEVLPCDTSYAVSIDVPENPLAGRQERGDFWAYAIDGVYLSNGTPASSFDQGIAVLSWGCSAFIKLWAIDLAKRAPPEAIIARSGGVYLRVIDSLMRHDAALSVGAPGAAQCGFAVPVSPSLSGTELVELFALGCNDTYVRIGEVKLRRPDTLPLSALPRSGRIRGHLDEITVNGAPVSAADDIAVAHGSVMKLRGWAVDEMGPRLSGGVFADIEGDTFEALRGRIRPDVAALLDAPDVAACEFEATIDTTSLSPGRHRISMFALTARRDAMGAFGDSIFVNVAKAYET